MPFFENWKILEPFLRGTLEHPNKALFQKGSRIFNMSLSYDGSLLYHLAAHMILLSTASSLLRCPLVLSLCWMLAAYWVASVAGIFAMGPSFGWLLCSSPPLASSHHHHQKEPSSPYALSWTLHVLHPNPPVRPLVLSLCRLVASVAGIFAVVVPTPTPLSHWHHCHRCTGNFAIVTTDTVVVHCHHQMHLHHVSLFWLIVVSAVHCSGGAADDYAAYCRSGVARQKTTMPTTKVPWQKTTPHISMAVRLKKTMPPIAMAARPMKMPRIAVAARQTMILRNAMAAQ
jgi:hypothetical protein